MLRAVASMSNDAPYMTVHSIAMLTVVPISLLHQSVDVGHTKQSVRQIRAVWPE
jgi:hypothetical protein